MTFTCAKIIMNPEELKTYLNQSLRDSVSQVFSATLSISPQIAETEKIISDESCIISSIGFAGTIDGTFSMCVPDSSACAITSRMLEAEIKEVSVEVADGIGELVNMIAGGVKMGLHNSDHNFNISIPTAIKGDRMVILSDFSETTRITLQYDFNGIVFTICLIYCEHIEKDSQKIAQLKAKTAAFDRLNQLVSNSPHKEQE